MGDQVPDSNSDTLGPAILKAPAPLWAKIKKLLQVETRDEAVAVVGQDQEAYAAVVQILAKTEESVLTRKRVRDESYLTSGKRAETPLAELMYGKGKAKVSF